MNRTPYILVALAVACTPTGQFCTEIGCSGTLTLTFEAETWAESVYEVTLDTGREFPERCRFTLPLSEPNPQAGSSCFIAPTFNGAELTVALPTPMDESLVEVDVALRLADVVLHESTLAPAWGEPFYPNGEVCDAGHGCRSAEANIAL
jgi:hypothetical protein